MKQKKRKPGADLQNLGFEETPARLIQTDPKELAKHKDRVAREVKDIAHYVEETTEDIRRGGQRFRKPFRL